MLQPGKSPIYPSPVRKLSTLLVLAAVPLLMLVSGPSASAAAARKHHTTKVASGHAGKRSASKKPSGQRVIDGQRATEIQTALIKAGYLSGEPTGHWDAASESAMIKLQSDNGWQTRLVPDSRALIKLGLGPSAPTAASSASPSTAANAGASPAALH